MGGMRPLRQRGWQPLRGARAKKGSDKPGPSRRLSQPLVSLAAGD